MQYNLIDATVHTLDGEAGKVWRVAMVPDSHKVTHLVVHQGILLGRNVVVPIEQIDRVREGHVYLTLSNEDLAQLPDYQETDFLAPEEGWEYPLGYPPGGGIWPMTMAYGGASTYPYLSNAVLKENLPDEDVSLSAGTHVECTDGHCGEIESVLYDEDSHEMTGFVIRRGFIFHREVKAPMSWIDHMDKERVYLKLTKRQVEEMGEYFEK